MRATGIFGTNFVPSEVRGRLSDAHITPPRIARLLSSTLMHSENWYAGRGRCLCKVCIQR